jgi:hypothetical protein
MKKQYDDDDGHVISSMEGLADIRARRIRRRIKADKVLPRTNATKREAWHIAYNATLAGLLIAGVLMGAVALVVFILTLVW